MPVEYVVIVRDTLGNVLFRAELYDVPSKEYALAMRLLIQEKFGLNYATELTANPKD